MHNHRIHAFHPSTPRITHSRKRHLDTSKVGNDINQSKLTYTELSPNTRSPNKLPSIATICNPESTREEASFACARTGLPCRFPGGLRLGDNDSRALCPSAFGLCHFYVHVSLYICIHVNGTCGALVQPVCARVCVGFRRVCISLGWSCGVFRMRVSEIKSVLKNTLRLLLVSFGRGHDAVVLLSDITTVWSVRLIFGTVDLESRACYTSVSSTPLLCEFTLLVLSPAIRCM